MPQMDPITLRVTSADGTGIAVETSGPIGAPAIVLVHGIAQSRQAFRGVLDGPLARDHRLVAFDLRGHGASDKPEAPEAYAANDRLGEDLHAVIATLGLDRPAVVAWSYGGIVVAEHLRRYGDAGLGRVVFLGAAVRLGKPAKGLLGPTMLAGGRGLVSDDDEVYRAAARTFLEGCFAAAPSGEHVDAMLAEMMLVPVHARRPLLMRSEDFDAELAASKLAFATIHGAEDSVILPAMSAHLASIHPGTRATVIPGVGHVVPVEAPAAFEAALRAAL